MPDSSAAMSDRQAANARTRPSSGSDRFTGTGNAGSAASSSDVMPRASATPAAPPITNSSAVSVRSCRTSRARPAPSVTRTAISRRRAVARASSTPATFAHAMTSTIDTSTINSPMNAAATPRRSAGSGDENATLHSRSAKNLSGCSRARPRPIASSSAAACALLTPGFNRPPIISCIASAVRRYPQIGRGDAHAAKSFARDAGDDERLPVDVQRPADDRGIGVEPPHPEVMAQDDERTGVRPWLPSAALEDPPGRGRHAERLEIIERDRTGEHAFGASVPVSVRRPRSGFGSSW